MSTTVKIACMECKEYLWVGQRNWIYTGEPETMQMLQGFLFKHQSSEYGTYVHNMQFLNEHYEDFYQDPQWTDFRDWWDTHKDDRMYEGGKEVKITLPEEAAKVFIESLENPPEPNHALRDAVLRAIRWCPASSPKRN